MGEDTSIVFMTTPGQVWITLLISQETIVEQKQPNLEKRHAREILE